MIAMHLQGPVDAAHDRSTTLPCPPAPPPPPPLLVDVVAPLAAELPVELATDPVDAWDELVPDDVVGTVPTHTAPTHTSGSVLAIPSSQGL